MVVCPNKSSKEWQSLVKDLGEGRAMFAFIRNNGVIPSTSKARELITNKGALESLQILSRLSEDSIIQTLKTNNLIVGEPIQEGDRTFYQLNTAVDDIGNKLGEFTSTYGTILEYKGDYVTIDKNSLASWNSIASAQQLQNKSLTELSKDFLKNIGVSLSEQDDVIKRFGSNGIADFAERMVRIQSGMVDEVIPEEALHFFLDMLPQDHPALLEALDKVRNTQTYKNTLEQYKNNPNYRVNGVINISKIKKEALAKELSAQMKREEKAGWAENILKVILDWINKTFIKKGPNDILRDLYFSGDISMLNTNLQSSEVYNQLNDQEKAYYEAQTTNEVQRQTLEKILAYIMPTSFDGKAHKYAFAENAEDAVIKSVTTVLGSDFFSELDNPDVMLEVTNAFIYEIPLATYKPDDSDAVKGKKIIDFIVDEILNGNRTQEEMSSIVGTKISDLLFKASEGKAKTLFGTAIHSIAEAVILGKKINLNVIDPSDPSKGGVDPIVYKLMDRATLEALLAGTATEEGLIQTIRNLVKTNHVVMSEVAISNGKLGGVLDIIAIDDQGVAHIYDFKTKFIKNFGEKPYIKKDLVEEFNNTINTKSPQGVKNETDTLKELIGKSRSNKQKYSQQLSIYKKMLMEAGIPVGSLNVIGIPYRLDADKKVSDIKIIIVKNIEFNKSLANYYFPNLDTALDASVKKPVESKEDPRLDTIRSIENNKLKEAFAKSLSRLTQIYRAFDKNKSKEELYKLLLNEGSKANKVQLQKSVVEATLDNFANAEEIGNFLEIQKNFLELIDSSAPIVRTAVEHFDNLKKSTPTNSEGVSLKLAELLKVKNFLSGYQNMFEELLDYFPDANQDNLVKKKLTDLIGVTSGVKSEYIKVISPDIVNMLGDVFNKDLLDNIKREYSELIAAANARGDVERAKELKKERDDLPSQKVIEELLKGNKGDTGWFFSKLVATISNPDIILAGVAKKMKATLDQVRLDNKKFRDGLSKELNKRFKIYGRGNVDVKAFNESLTYISEEFNPITGKTMQVLYFQSEFNEKLYSDYNKLKYNLKQANESKDKVAITDAKKAIKDFENKNFQTGYTEEYYKLTAPLETKVRYQGKDMTVREIEGQIRDEINKLERLYSNDDIETGAFNPAHLKELQKLHERRAELRDIIDSKGNPKIGDDLRIADALNEYDKNKAKLYTTEEQTEYFNRVNEKAKLEMGGEDSEEYKKWFIDNTRIVIKEEYFKEISRLYDEKGKIVGDIGKSDEINDLYAKLRQLTKPYKDKDGTIRGAMLSDEAADKVKKIHDQIDELSLNMEDSLFNGYTKQEKDRRKAILYLKNNGLPYDQMELTEIIESGKSRLQARMIADPLLAEKIDRLKEINEQLWSMSKKENTPYYEETLENEMQLFATANSITIDQLKEEGTWMEQFKESDWFINNHIINKKVLYEDQETGERRETSTEIPTYQWRRNMPIEKYIERKPGRQFSRTVLKESYTDEKGNEIMLQDPDNLDIQRRFKPKTNEQYRKQFGTDHPYLNIEFYDLKIKNENGSASAKEKVDYENLLYIQEQMINSQENIEPSQRIGLAVPFLEKELFERTVESRGKNIKEKAEKTGGKLSSIWQAIKRAFTRTAQDVDQEGIPTSEESDRNDISKLATMDNSQIKFIPVRFSTKGEAENASYDVWGGVLNYIGSITRKSALDKELAFVNGIEEILSGKENQPKSESRNLILNNIYKKYLGPEYIARINKGGNTRLEVLKSFINSVMYNETSFEGIDILGINSQKALNNVMALSSFTILGAAPLNWVTNWISGNVQNFVEAAGGKIYNIKDFNSANTEIYTGGKYGSPIKDMQEDYVKVGNLSFWGQIMEVFDPMQGEFENEFGKKTNFNVVKNIFRQGLYAGKIWGEWEIQMKSFIAFMKNHKLYDGEIVDRETFITKKIGTDLDGMSPSQINKLRLDALKEFEALDINLLDMMELNKEGILDIKDQYKSSFQFGSGQFSDIVAKLHALQKKLNGSYNQFDKAYVEKMAIGKMMYFFRKYFLPIGINRWGVRRVNYESMKIEQGFYLTFIQTMGKDLAKFRFNVIANWNNYSPDEKIAIAKTLTDIGIVLGIWLAYSVLLGYDPDDKDRFKKLREKGWAAEAAVFLLLKVRSETEQFLPYAGLNEIKSVYSNPSLVFNETTRYINITKLIGEHMLNVLPGVDFNSDLYYSKDVDQSGLKDKGDSKLISAAIKSIIGYTGRIINPDDAIKSFEYMQRMK